MYAYVYVCMHMCVHKCVCMCVHIFVDQHIDIYAGHILCIYEEKISTHVCIFEYIYTCACIYLSCI